MIGNVIRSVPARNRLLGMGALVFAGGAVVALSADVLHLLDYLERDAIAGVSVPAGLSVVSSVLTVAAFSVAGVGFLGDAGDRSQRLGAAALLLAGGFLCSLIGAGIRYGVLVAHDASGSYSASEACSAVANGLTAIAALIAATAFLRTPTGGAKGRPWPRDRRLGSAAIWLTGGFALALASGILLVVYLSDSSATSDLTRGYGVAAAGRAVSVIAAVIAATAFPRAIERTDHPWIRDRGLGLSAAVFACAFLLAGVGGIIAAGAASANGYDAKQEAALWLTTASSLVLVGATACASAGLFRSRASAAAPAPPA